MKKVKTVDLNYEPGDFCITQKHPYGEKAHRNKRGAYVNPIGFGNATETTSSKFWLTVDTGKGYARVRIDRYFKDRGKKLTPKRREKLEDTMPDKVNISQLVSMYGNSYLVVDDNDMDAWSKAAGIK